MDLRYLVTLILPFLLLLLAGIPTASSDPLPALFHPSSVTLNRALSAQASQRLGLLQHHAGTTDAKKRPSEWEDLELLDTVLVGTIDGGLHAMERSTGRRIWSRLIVGNGVVQSDISNETWRPTMKTASVEKEAQDSESPVPTDPAYIVDPYDGQLYVQVELADGGNAVQKLPLTMEQLIDLSPFTFPQEQSHVFIGSRSTSLLAIDLQTGKSISSFGRKASVIDEDCLKRFESKIMERSLEDGDALAKDKIESAKAKCSKSIDERPEDRLLIGRTDYHLSIHAGMNGRVQDLSFTKLVPNSAHKELAEYWRKNGNIKGEVYVSERSRSRDSSTSFVETPVDGHVENHNGDRIKTEVEMENRWRIEVLHDGTIVGIEQEKGVRWHNSLPSIAISVYDVLLPTSAGSQPILLPQPPAYVPTLFGQENLNLQLLALPVSTYISRLPVLIDGESSESTEEGDSVGPPVDLDQERSATAVTVFATSSDHCPLIALAPRAKPNELLGGHIVQDAVKERLPYPYLLDPSNERGTVNRSKNPHEDSKVDSSPPVQEIPVEQESRNGFIRFWTRMWNRWWFWSLMMIVGFSVLLLIFDQRLRRLADTQGSQHPARNSADGVAPARVSVAVPMDTVVTNGKSAVVADPEKGQIDLVEGPIKASTGKKNNGRRRKRGKRKSNKDDNDKNDSGSDDSDVPLMAAEADGKTNGKQRMLAESVVSGDHSSGSSVPSKVSDTSMEGLTITEEVLGFGSHGTVVYKGVFQGRAVAVKRLLQDFVTVASQEVSLLQASDDHENVIRYFCQEKRDNFLYIALELCPATLADVVEQPELHQDLAVAFEPKKALYQVTSGLRHLHALKIIHRDIKPQNVLISVKKNGSLRMMLSDFGLAKRLDHGQSSYIQTGKHAIGSVGWRAPECLRGDVQLDDLFEGSTPSGSIGDDDVAVLAGRKKAPGSRLTKAVDLFALGCLYFYTLTGGYHPYGDRYEREVNIIRNEKVGMAKLDAFGEDGHEAAEILDRLLSPHAENRPDTSVCLVHPLFWSASKRLAFLCDASDRFEIMELQPPEPTLVLLENKASNVVGQNWQKRLDTLFLENLGKHRKYDGRSVRDLLRALRNKKNHYQDLPPNVQRRLGTLPAGFLNYFTSRFPALFTHVHGVVRESKLRTEAMFVPYFDIEE